MPLPLSSTRLISAVSAHSASATVRFSTTACFFVANTGSITLSKYVEDAQGLLSKPQSGSYRIHVSSPGYNEIFTLSSRNSFTETIGPLPSATYVIDELDHEDVSYIIDGGSQVDRAIVAVNGTAHQVQVINREQVAESGSITMAKYIRQMVC